MSLLAIPTPDLSTQEGAELLARRLKSYWACKGIEIETTVVLSENPTGLRDGPIYCVRTNLNEKRK